jgi:hypothetical protein
MTWQILLKQSQFPTTWVDWVELLELPDARLNSWVEAMKSLLTVDESPQGYRSFSNSLRRDADDFINGIWGQVREVNPDLNWRTESAKRGQLENAFNILKEGFEDKLYTDSGASQTSNMNRERALDIFNEAAERINRNVDINWDNLEETLSIFNDARHITAFRRELGDDANRTIAANIPEGEYPRLNDMYRHYTDVAESQNYVVNDVTTGKAFEYLTLIQEPTLLTGNAVRAVGGFGPRRLNRVSTRPFQIQQLDILQTRRGNYRRFTEIFKGILQYDLNDSNLGLADKLTSVMRNKAVNRGAIKERIMEAAWEINQGIDTKEDKERQLGLVLPDFPLARAENRKDFNTSMDNWFDKNIGEERAILRQMESKMVNYKKGSTKLFRDFIVDILTKPGIYKSILDNIWADGYNAFRSEAPQDDDLGFRHIDSMPSMRGQKIPIRALPSGLGVYSTRTKDMHEVLILNTEPKNNEDAWDELVEKWFDFQDENEELKDDILFGDLLQAGDEDEGAFLRQFTDPFRKSIAIMFQDVIDEEFELENLTGNYAVSLRDNINIFDLIKEILTTERAVLEKSDMTRLLQNDGSIGSALNNNPNDEQVVELVNTFYQAIDAIITNIRNGVVELVKNKLDEMVRLQGEYLQYNDTIYALLFAEGFLRFGGGSND